MSQSERWIPQTVYLGSHRAIALTRFGTKLFFDTRDLTVGIPIALDGDWEPWLNRFMLPLVRGGDVVVDVGANIGFYTTLFASLAGPGGHVHSFECNPALATLLRDTIEINNLESRCTLYTSALCDRVGEITFYQPEKHLGAGNLRGGGLSNDTFASITVPATTLDAIFTGSEGPVRLMHMDVESAEPMVIAGGHGFIERHPDMIIVLEIVGNMYRMLEGPNPARGMLEYLASTGRILCLVQNDIAAQASIDVILGCEITNAVAIPAHLAEGGVR